MSTPRRAFWIFVITTAGLGVPLHARAEDPKISVEPAAAVAGSSVTITGNIALDGDLACPDGDAVTLTSDAALFPPDGFGPQVDRDATGSFATTYVLPASAPEGAYVIGMRCGGGNIGVTAALEITAVAPTIAPASTTEEPSTDTGVPSSSNVEPSLVIAPGPSVATTSADDGGDGGLNWVLVILIAAVVVGGGAWVAASTRRRR